MIYKISEIIWIQEESQMKNQIITKRAQPKTQNGIAIMAFIENHRKLKNQRIGLCENQENFGSLIIYRERC